jgi:hypothetical protein
LWRIEVLEDGVGQLDAGPPAFAVEEFDLHPAPEGLDDGVEAVSIEPIEGSRPESSARG